MAVWKHVVDAVLRRKQQPSVLEARTAELVREAEALPEMSGDAKRAKVLRRLVTEFPTTKRQALILGLELAVDALKKE